MRWYYGLTSGTSPHTRGKQQQEFIDACDARNIPAYAGKTRRCRRFYPKAEEHPRIRGENPVAGRFFYPTEGTSPHTRGKQCNTLPNTPNSRNIPAYAGKTITHLRGDRTASEHPRIRGENHQQAYTDLTRAGTSPHTRGKRSIGFMVAAYPTEHPRIRGENT